MSADVSGVVWKTGEVITAGRTTARTYEQKYNDE